MNGRKARQLRSQGGQKRLRRGLKKNRATAAEHNAALEAMQAEAVEAQAVYEEAVEVLKREPQFAIVNPFSGETLLIAAQSMIWPLEVDGYGEPVEKSEAAPPSSNPEATPAIILPEVRADTPFGTVDGGVPAPAGLDVSKVILPGTAEALGVETP